MSKEPFVPEVGPWAQEKLKCLGDYLAAYTTVLRKQKFKGYVYIDAFAGAGLAKIKKKKQALAVEADLFSDLLKDTKDSEQETFVLGSPRVALGLQHPFTIYVFIELNEKRRKELEGLKKDYPKTDIRIRNQDCNEYLLELLNRKDINWKEWRGVVFLDPFGAHVPWETVNALARTGSFEVFINFPSMAINRLADNDGDIPPGNRAILDGFFGSDEWFDVMFNKQQQTLFGGTTANKAPEATKALLNWYRKRLQTAFGFASSAKLIRNSKNSPLYYLIWAGPKKAGHSIADHILSKGESI